MDLNFPYTFCPRGTWSYWCQISINCQSFWYLPSQLLFNTVCLLLHVPSLLFVCDSQFWFLWISCNNIIFLCSSMQVPDLKQDEHNIFHIPAGNLQSALKGINSCWKSFALISFVLWQNVFAPNNFFFKLLLLLQWWHQVARWWTHLTRVYILKSYCLGACLLKMLYLVIALAFQIHFPIRWEWHHLANNLALIPGTLLKKLSLETNAFPISILIPSLNIMIFHSTPRVRSGTWLLGVLECR